MKDDTTNHMLAGALAIAAGSLTGRPCPVFPCSPENKRPLGLLVPHGFKDAAADPEQIKQWWHENPGAMIGVPTGAASGFFVVDQDRKPGMGDGVETWNEWCREHRREPLPVTRKHNTPSTGRHALYRCPRDLEIRSIKLGALGPGIEIKGEGGYVIVPPSVMAGGAAYTASAIDEIADPPGWLLDMIRRHQEHRGNGRDGDVHPSAEFESAMEQYDSAGVSEEARDNDWVAVEEVQAALDVIVPGTIEMREPAWFEIGCALHHVLGDEKGFPLFEGCRKKWPHYDAARCRRKWRKVKAANITAYTAGTIFHYADQADPDWRARYEASRGEQSAKQQSAQARQQAAAPRAAPQQGRAPAKLDALLNSAADLQSMVFDPLRMIVPAYLPEGLTLIAGKPKIGKSWWVLDVGVGVADGGTCMGQQCEQGDVLALMLDDGSKRRLQRRLTKMLGAQRQQWPAALTYAVAWPRLNAGGLDLIREWIKKASKPRLIVVDILERVRQRIPNNQRASQYTADYDALIELQKIATEHQLAILVVHHQRKMGADDLIDTVSGTLGLGGAVDTVLILGKDQFGKFLYGRGQDLDEFNVAVGQNEQGRWQVLGPRLEAQASPERAGITAVLARANRPMTVQEIAAAVGQPRDNVKKLLSAMHLDGKVERVATGLYQLPAAQEDMPF